MLNCVMAEADSNVLPQLSPDAPMRPGDLLDFYICYQDWLKLDENELIISRTWTAEGAVEVDSFRPLAELVIENDGEIERYQYLEQVYLTAPVATDGEYGTGQAICQVTTSRGRIVSYGFTVEVADFPELTLS